MTNRWKEIGKPVLVLAVICLVVSAALAGANRLTAEPIAEAERQNTEDAMRRVLKADRYEEIQGALDGEPYTGYIAKNGEETAGYIFLTEENGYAGAVSVMTGIAPDGKVLAVEILDVTSETVGLGQNAAKPAFKNQFAGKTGPFTVNQSGGSGGIDALTGATITSKAVTNAVNTALELYTETTGGEK